MSEWITELNKHLANIEAVEDNDEATIALRAVLDELGKLSLSVSATYTERILAMHRDDGMSYGEIGEAVGVSRARVGQIMNKSAVPKRKRKARAKPKARPTAKAPVKGAA